jgi:SAM-dependent methyltransferase
MDIKGWNERYLTTEADDAPTPLLVETATRLRPGKALDLACGTGRNALWLARNGWTVTAVDGAPAAIEILQRKAAGQKLAIEALVADLERGEYQIETAAWDLVAMCYYLQRDLFEAAKQAVVPNGTLLAIVHITEPGEEPTSTRMQRGELKSYFQDWDILHYFEGKPGDAAHRRAVAELVAKPRGSES